ncbi:MAG: REP-associated tyrosine transposase [Gammaproteobacteria bacterium]
MSQYCDNRVPGQTYFFTVRLQERGSTLLTDHISAFGEAIRQARSKKPFHVDAWVALPDHAHAIWTLPPGDTDCASRWRSVKIAFSKALSKSTRLRGNDAIWERHYRDYAIEDDADYNRLVDYVHTDPLRHGFCRTVEEWPWSSHHRFVAAGLIVPSGRAQAPLH